MIDRNKVYNICYLYVVINAMEYLRDLTIPGLKQAKLWLIGSFTWQCIVFGIDLTWNGQFFKTKIIINFFIKFEWSFRSVTFGTKAFNTKKKKLYQSCPGNKYWMAPQRITLLLIKDQTKHKNIKLSFKEYFDIVLG